jgi:hypothetical protein
MEMCGQATSHYLLELQKQALNLPFACSIASKYHHAQAVLCLEERQKHLVHPTPQCTPHSHERMLHALHCRACATSAAAAIAAWARSVQLIEIRVLCDCRSCDCLVQTELRRVDLW